MGGPPQKDRGDGYAVPCPFCHLILNQKGTAPPVLPAVFSYNE